MTREREEQKKGEIRLSGVIIGVVLGVMSLVGLLGWWCWKRVREWKRGVWEFLMLEEKEKGEEDSEGWSESEEEGREVGEDDEGVLGDVESFAEEGESGSGRDEGSVIGTGTGTGAFNGTGSFSGAGTFTGSGSLLGTGTGVSSGSGAAGESGTFSDSYSGQSTAPRFSSIVSEHPPRL